IVRAIEAIEDVSDAVRADADSLIGDPERERTGRKPYEGHRYGPPFRSVLHRIVEKIHEKLFPTHRIDMRAHSGFYPQIPLMSPIVRQPSSLNGPPRDGRNVGPAWLDLELPALNVRSVDQLGDARRPSTGRAAERI